MSINFDLKADSREKLGSAESRRLRKSGNIPAIIYGDGNNLNITVPTKEFEREYYKGDIYTTLITLDIAGKTQKVLVNKIDVDPVRDRPTHITFVAATKEVKAKVKVRFFNREKSPGIKKGGFLHIVTRKIELICPIEEIPTEITFDLSSSKVGDKVRSTDLELPANISFAAKNEFNVGSILGRGSKEEEAPTLNADGTEITPEEGIVTEEGAEEAPEGDKEESKE
jgi:large subunit ribosomal protein L25